MDFPDDLIRTFRNMAELVSAKVLFISKKEELLQAIKSHISSSNHQQILFPGINPEIDSLIKSIISSSGKEIAYKNFRNHPQDHSIGISMAKAGIAETGSLVFIPKNEDDQLCGMLSSRHIVLLDPKDIFKTAEEFYQATGNDIYEENPFVAFVTGASRTADIERVLALGAHGPLELIIYLVSFENIAN